MGRVIEVDFGRDKNLSEEETFEYLIKKFYSDKDNVALEIEFANLE